MNTIAKPPLLKITAVQLLTLMMGAFVLLLVGKVQAYSLLVGGLIQILGSAYFARLAYRYQGASQVGKTVQAMYQGESGKIVLCAALFAIAFVFIKPLNYVAFFSGYAVMVVMHLSLTAKILQQRRN